MYLTKWKINDDINVSWETSAFGLQTIMVSGIEVSSQYKFRPSHQTEFALPGGKTGLIKVQMSGFAQSAELYVNGELVLSTSEAKNRSCQACHAADVGNDNFCQKCGAALPAKAVTMQQSKLKSATTSIIVLAVMYFLSAIAFYYIQQNTIAESMKVLSSYQDSDNFPTPIEGKTYTVGELKKSMEFQKWQVLILNTILGLIMVGLAIWSKKAPLPALIVASGIYVIVIVGNAFVDPRTLGQGIYMKVIIIGVLFQGIKSGLALQKKNG